MSVINSYENEQRYENIFPGIEDESTSHPTH